MEVNMKVLIYIAFASVYMVLANGGMPSRRGYAILAIGYLFLAIISLLPTPCWETIVGFLNLGHLDF